MNNILTAISLSILGFTSASLAGEKSPSADAMYKSIEPQVRKDWDRLEQEREAANGKPDPDKLMAFPFYNRAVAIAKCAEEAPLERDNPQKGRANQECIDARLAEINEVMQLVSYSPPDKRDLVSDCVTKGHDAPGELRFPPYDFLRSPSAQLFDFKKVRECILVLVHSEEHKF